MALVAAAALSAPVAAHANTNADGAVRQTKATAATCAFEGLSTCPARRTKLFQFWGKVAETVDDTSSVELELRGVEHTGTLGTQLRKRLGDVVDLRLTGTTKFTKIDFNGGRSKISKAQLLQVAEDNPRATLYVDARMWPNSVWNDDEPILRAVRIVVDLSDLPVPAAGQGLSVAYFANKDLSGTPFATGTDNTVDFDWGGGGPVVADRSHRPVLDQVDGLGRRPGRRPVRLPHDLRRRRPPVRRRRGRDGRLDGACRREHRRDRAAARRPAHDRAALLRERRRRRPPSSRG